MHAERLGWFAIDKPSGITSHTAVQIVRRTLGIGGRKGTRAGHTGTLDPFATGLLVVLIGRATRLVPWLHGCNKRYLLEIRFGVATSTDDSDGEVIQRCSRPRISSDELHLAVQEVAARTYQVPPAVSAIHIDGERAWRRTKRGEDVEMPVRDVVIEPPGIISEHRTASGEIESVTIDVRCSAGTYMRSLARDVAVEIGSVGHAGALRRLEAGAIDMDNAVRPDAVTWEHLRTIEDVRLLDLERFTVESNEEAVAFCYGQSIEESQVSAHNASDRRKYDEVLVSEPGGEVLGIGKVSEGLLKPLRVMRDPQEFLCRT